MMRDDEYTLAVKRHSNRIYLIALSYTGSHCDAEDIAQDVFLKLYKSDVRFESEEHLKKWLTAVCVNRSKDHLRTSFFKRNTVLENAKELYRFDTPRSFDIFNAVMKLPKKERVAIHLFYYEDMSVKDISETLGIKESAIKTRLSRARQKIKETLGDDWINEQ